MNQSNNLLKINSKPTNYLLLKKNIITSRLELEELQDTGERAIRWFKRFSKTPQPTV